MTNPVSNAERMKIMTLVQKTKRCAGCDAPIYDDSYEVVKSSMTGEDGIKQWHEAIMCGNCIKKVEWFKEFVITHLEPNENGDYEMGSITLRKSNT
jgi:hypothetical protein